MSTMFFNRIEGAIEIRGRLEEDGMLGHFYHVLQPGEEILGVTYADLDEYGDGTITFDDEGQPIVEPHSEDEEDEEEEPSGTEESG